MVYICSECWRKFEIMDSAADIRCPFCGKIQQTGFSNPSKPRMRTGSFPAPRRVNITSSEGDFIPMAASRDTALPEDYEIMYRRTDGGVEAVCFNCLSIAQPDVVVPSEYHGIPVVAIAEEAFKNAHLRSVKLPETLRVIGKSAFEGCCELESVSGGAALMELACCAFKDCVALESVYFTGLAVGDPTVFAGCYSLGIEREGISFR